MIQRVSSGLVAWKTYAYAVDNFIQRKAEIDKLFYLTILQPSIINVSLHTNLVYYIHNNLT